MFMFSLSILSVWLRSLLPSAHTIFSQMKTRGTALRSLLWQTITDTTKTLKTMCSLSLNLSLYYSLYRPCSSCIQDTHFLHLFTCKYIHTGFVHISSTLWNISSWIFHVSHIRLISPVCILTQWMKAKLWSGWFISLWWNFSKLTFTLPLLRFPSPVRHSL